MESGRRKIRICLTIMVLIAVVAGICYYYSSAGKADRYKSDGTLVNSQEEQDGC